MEPGAITGTDVSGPAVTGIANSESRSTSTRVPASNGRTSWYRYLLLRHVVSKVC